MTNPQNMSLEEARKTMNALTDIKNTPPDKLRPWVLPLHFVEKLIAAALLIGREEGREKTKKEDVEIILSMQKAWDEKGYPIKGSPTVMRELLRAIKNRILSPDFQQNISSN